MIPGITVSMGGNDWTVPPLTLGQMRRLLPKVKALQSIGVEMNEEQIGIVGEVVAAALQRNYPDMTAERVEDLIDMGNAAAVLNAVLTGSGLRPTIAGEAAAVSIGPGSTASSPPPAATAIP